MRNGRSCVSCVPTLATQFNDKQVMRHWHGEGNEWHPHRSAPAQERWACRAPGNRCEGGASNQATACARAQPFRTRSTFLGSSGHGAFVSNSAQRSACDESPDDRHRAPRKRCDANGQGVDQCAGQLGWSTLACDPPGVGWPPWPRVRAYGPMSAAYWTLFFLCVATRSTAMQCSGGRLGLLVARKKCPWFAARQPYWAARRCLNH